MDKLYIISAMVIILLWSGLGHSKIVTFLGICTAIWLPISLRLYSFLLRWMPLIEGHRSYLETEKHQQSLERFAAGLIAAGGTIFLLILLPPQQAFIDSIAINLIILMALFNMREQWIPNALILLTFLAGLFSGTLIDQASSNIYAAILSWIVAWMGLTTLSFLYRQNFLSQRDILLFTACGCWSGLKAFTLFFLLTLFFLWVFPSTHNNKANLKMNYTVNQAGLTVWNFLTPAACLTALTITIFVKTFLNI